MNGEQMEFLAKEFADGLTGRMKLVFEFSERQMEAIQVALVLAWLEGFGRGQKRTQAIVDRVFENVLAKLVAAPPKAS